MIKLDRVLKRNELMMEGVKSATKDRVLNAGEKRTSQLRRDGGNVECSLLAYFGLNVWGRR